MRRMSLIAIVVLLLGVPAFADWKEGDPCKMHYPQLPDPNGWDIMATAPRVLADDFQCTSTGPITDIHFWGSWKGNGVGRITNARLSVHANVPAGDGVMFSRPGELLWSWDVEPSLIGDEPVWPQGWYDPKTGGYSQMDHTLWFQYNIVNIPNPFIQEKGRIYWLDIQVTTTTGSQWGWKTSRSPQFMDDAVWADGAPGQPITGWQPIVDPITGVSLDLAFVITPEPASLLMLALCGLWLPRRRQA